MTQTFRPSRRRRRSVHRRKVKENLIAVGALVNVIHSHTSLQEVSLSHTYTSARTNICEVATFNVYQKHQRAEKVVDLQKHRL